MFSSRKSSAPAVSAGTPDPQFNYVTALLHGDGTNGAQNNTFVDSSTNAFTITRNGTPTQGSFSPYGSLWSNYFSSSAYLTTSGNTAFDFTTADVTIEAWIYLSALGTTQVIVATGPTGGSGFSAWSFEVYNTNYLTFDTFYGGTEQTLFATNNPLTANTWNHVAYTRASGTSRLFVNGVSCTFSGTLTQQIYSGGYALTIGQGAYVGYLGPLTGYISNLRIVKGTALYTSNFTPPTTPLTAVSGTSLLTCQSNRFIDNSSNAFALTASGTPSVQRFNPFLPTSSQAYSTSVYGGSGNFNGTTDYLTGTLSTAIGSGNFTIECWVYLRALVDYEDFFSITRGAFGFNIGTDSTGVLTIYNNVGGRLLTSSTGALKVNQWTHVAYVRSGTTLTGFINGVSFGTVTNATVFSATAFAIGDLDSSNSEYLNGYLTDTRLTNTVVYSGNFTPSTAPLSAVSGTLLLVNYQNGAIYDNAMMEDWLTIGTAQISTSQKKYGTGSLYFNGSSNLYTIGKPIYDFYNGDFTVEAWVYVTSVSATQIIASCGPTGGSGFSAWTLQITSTGYLLFDTFYGGTEQFITATTNPLSANTWYHVAYTRASGTSRLFVSGNSCTFSGSITQQIISGGYPLTVGAGSYTGYTGPMTGYIDDLRITKGYARYTANFTPPTAALPNYGS